MDDNEPADEAPEPSDSPCDVELANRLWLKAAAPLLETCSKKSDQGRVQFALGMAAIAVCERITRICHSDLAIRPSN